MKVVELIEKLEEYPDNYDIIVGSECKMLSGGFKNIMVRSYPPRDGRAGFLEILGKESTNDNN